MGVSPTLSPTEDRGWSPEWLHERSGSRAVSLSLRLHPVSGGIRERAQLCAEALHLLPDWLSCLVLSMAMKSPQGLETYHLFGLEPHGL